MRCRNLRGKKSNVSMGQRDKSELTELFRARDASCPKGKKMEHRKSLTKSEFVERFLELSLFYGLSSPLNSEMICIFPYF